MTTLQIIALTVLPFAIIVSAIAYIVAKRKEKAEPVNMYAEHPLLPPPTDWEQLHTQVKVITDALFKIDGYKVELANTSDLYTLQAIANYIYDNVSKEIDRREEEGKETDNKTQRAMTQLQEIADICKRVPLHFDLSYGTSATICWRYTSAWTAKTK